MLYAHHKRQNKCNTFCLDATVGGSYQQCGEDIVLILIPLILTSLA